ncbi:universal stress protein UspA [Arthrobacter sp. SW1]|uniref:universal stress protein n=1 Tax=Arthrobacter sp. SW1 TaxID=1920889 RepID=UPI000877B9AB|nr:universal stress protein [Arthrobacter sp. SW1]OFI36964.1 universal stress protein UspA [Arthrobacter sp. SW1]
MSEIVVVGVDGSETARRAAETARTLAQGLGAKLHIVTAFEGDRVSLHGAGSERAIVFGDPGREAKATASKVAASLPQEGVEIEAFSAVGSPAQALIAHAENHNASVIVVGNRRMKGLSRVLGSVANTVAHNAPCDVYIADTVE